MNERTNPLAYSLSLSRSLFRSLSLSPSASGRGAPDPRTALSRAGQVDEPSRLCSLPRGPRSTLVCRWLARSHARTRACVRTTRVCVSLPSRALIVGATTHTRNLERRRKRRGGTLFLSFSLYASRTAVPVSRNQRLRSLLIDLILLLLVSLFLSLFLPSRGPVVVSPSAPRGRCPASFRPVSGETRQQRETDGESTTDQPIQSTNRTTLSTVHYRSTATSMH